jgi:hypothetical protein
MTHKVALLLTVCCIAVALTLLATNIGGGVAQDMQMVEHPPPTAQGTEHQTHPQSEGPHLAAQHGGMHGLSCTDTRASGEVVWAFCDTFDAPAPVSRSGQLSNARWSVARNTQSNNPSSGGLLNWPATEAMMCRDPMTGILPPDDYFFCDNHGMESMHWMEAFDDGGAYAWNAARIRQPFDFAGRTGTIVWDVDAKTFNEHSWWVEVGLTDEPIPGAHPGAPGSSAVPRNGLFLRLFADCGQPGQLGGLGALIIVRNYQNGQDTDKAPFNNDANRCYRTVDDSFNHFELRLSQQRLELWASDAGGANFQRRAWVDNLNLPFTRGYVSFQHSQYNAAKGSPQAHQTYHWDNIGFDGPVLPTPRGYDVPDAHTVPGVERRSDEVKLGYDLKNGGGTFACCAPGKTWPTVAVPPFTLSNVNLSGATGARLHLNLWNFTAGKSLNYRFNSGTWRPYTNPGIPGGETLRALSIPVALGDLKSGTNTLELQAVGAEMIAANIDLTVELGTAAPPPPASTATSAKTTSPTPSANRSPTDVVLHADTMSVSATEQLRQVLGQTQPELNITHSVRGYWLAARTTCPPTQHDHRMDTRYGAYKCRVDLGEMVAPDARLHGFVRVRPRLAVLRHPSHGHDLRLAGLGSGRSSRRSEHVGALCQPLQF